MDLSLLHLQRPYRFESPFDGEFVLLLEITDPAVSVEERRSLTQSVVDSGCRYVLCRGVECSSWHDSIDDALVLAELADASKPFVMTTWHDDECLQETLEFMLLHTAFDDFVPTAFAIVEVGGDGRMLTVAKEALAGVRARVRIVD